MGKQENCSCLPSHDENDFFLGKNGLFSSKKVFFFGKKIKWGVHVDVQRVQTVVTKKESESFCVH